MSWAAVMLFGSGLVFSTGLVWFFVQAWIFAIQARTLWLIALLTITTTVAILSQGYLCAIFVSIPPGSKPRGVTRANREAFASFPFDATATLVRRKGSDARPSIGWELKPAQQVAASPGHQHPPETTAASCTAAVVRGTEDDRQQPNPAGGEIQRLPPLWRQKEDTDADHGINPAQSPKSGETLHLMAPSAGGGGLRGGGGGGGGDRGRGLGSAKIASSRVGAAGARPAPAPATDHCVEDVVESGRAEPFVLTRTKSKLAPFGLPKENECEIEENGGMRPEFWGFCKSLDDKESAAADFGSRLQAQRRHRRHRHRPPTHHHHHASQEMKRCSTWTASGQTDVTATLGSDDDDDDDDDDEATRFRCGSVGSSIDCCSETAEVGCRGCAEAGKGVPVQEQQTRKAVGVSSLLMEQETVPATTAGTAGGNKERLTEEPVVRVSELPDVCAICLGQYATGEEVHVLPCLHIFHAECLDVWITGHPSCPYCKGDLNVLPPESDRAAESSAAAYTCSLLSGLPLLFTWPFNLVREFRDRRRQHRQQQQEQNRSGEDEVSDSNIVNLASTPFVTPASSPAVLPEVVA